MLFRKMAAAGCKLKHREIVKYSRIRDIHPRQMNFATNLKLAIVLVRAPLPAPVRPDTIWGKFWLW
jgi:hypothetical protein